MKHFIAKLIPEKIKGQIDFRFRPSQRQGFGGPLNGSSARRIFVEQAVAKIGLHAFIETGTYKGTTTDFFSRFSLPVYTSESSARCFGYCEQRFKGNKNVEIFFGDSRAFLASIVSRNEVPKKNVLFYLDAHWGADLPLPEELSKIASGWKDSIVMVDDFQVPDDTGYGYDDYGGESVLNLALVARSSFPTTFVFFPSLSSSEEVGAKRGWVVLTDSRLIAEKLKEIPQLRFYSNDR